MDAALLAGLTDTSPLVVIVVEARLPDQTIYWTDGGFVVWGDHTYQAEHPVYGTVDSIEEIEDGADNGTTRCAITILPPDGTGMVQLANPATQGSYISVHLGAVDRTTGLLIGIPDPLFFGELDFGRLGVGGSWSLVLECGTEEARCLEMYADQRLSDSYHKAIWSGERGLEHVTDTKRKIHWTWKRS